MYFFSKYTMPSQRHDSLSPFSVQVFNSRKISLQTLIHLIKKLQKNCAISINL